MSKEPSPLNARVMLALVALVAIVGGIVVLTIGSGGGKSSSGISGSTSANAAAAAHYEAAGLITPIRPAPPLQLRNYLGQPVNIASYRGKAVLVTFLYTHCPDICPLITSQLRVAQNLMGTATAAKAEIIAVSVDPRGDTTQNVAAFLARHEMTGRMQYLVGSTKELAAAWSAWGVGSERDAEKPEYINHSGLIYGIGGSGKRITIYAPTFKPSEIAHDVPLLAAS